MCPLQFLETNLNYINIQVPQELVQIFIRQEYRRSIIARMNTEALAL